MGSLLNLSAVELSYLAIFGLVFGVSLTMDILGHRKSKTISMKNALLWSGVWIAVSLAFGWVTWVMLGAEAGAAYYNGWVLEKVLAVDNLFAFVLVFSSFKLKDDSRPELEHVQHRILHWGIIGAIAFRVLLLMFIGWLLAMPQIYHKWIMTGFSVVILASVAKIVFGGKTKNYKEHRSVWLWNHTFGWLIPAYTKDDYGSKFVVRAPDAKTGKMRLHTTDALLCMFVMEVVDIIFAGDSMPAVASVTKNPVVMCTCSLMAVAGLRQLYFVLAAAEKHLTRLEPAVICLLVYIAGKVVVHEWFHWEIGMWLNLGIVAVFLGIGVVASLLFPKKKEDNDSTTKTDEVTEAKTPVATQ